MKIYPNPAKDQIHINAKIDNIKICDVLGKNIENYYTEQSDNKTSIFFESIKPGINSIKHESNTQKIIIE